MKILGPEAAVKLSVFSLVPGTIFKYDGDYLIRSDVAAYDGKCESYSLTKYTPIVTNAWENVHYYPEAVLHIGIER